jgi:YD repeat-containing protein
MKTFITSVVLLLTVSVGVSGQRVSFNYDYAGNRTSRIIIMSSKSKQQQDTQEKQPAGFSEVLAGILINIYPNPTEGLIKVDIQNLPEGETANLNLYTLSGNLIVSKQKVTSSTEINITGQAAGIYILKIVAGKEQTEWKIIKK